MGKRYLIIWHGPEDEDFLVCTDWFDAADLIKQQNLKGFPVTIYKWEYSSNARAS